MNIYPNTASSGALRPAAGMTAGAAMALTALQAAKMGAFGPEAQRTAQKVEIVAYATAVVLAAWAALQQA